MKICGNLEVLKPSESKTNNILNKKILEKMHKIAFNGFMFSEHMPEYRKYYEKQLGEISKIQAMYKEN